MLDFEDIEIDNLTKSQEFNAVVNKIKNIDEVGVFFYNDYINKTVASEEVVNKEDYDFPSLEEAIRWINKTVVLVDYNGSIRLRLEDGTHYIINSEIKRLGFTFGPLVNRLRIEGISRNMNNVLLTIPDFALEWNSDLTLISANCIAIQFLYLTIDLMNYISEFPISIAESTLFMYKFRINTDRNAVYASGSTIIVYDSYFKSRSTQNKSGFKLNGSNVSLNGVNTFEDVVEVFYSKHSKNNQCLIVGTLNLINSGISNDKLNTILPDNNYINTGINWIGTSIKRPLLSEVGDKPYMDTDLGHPIWFNGVDWVDALGNVV